MKRHLRVGDIISSNWICGGKPVLVTHLRSKKLNLTEKCIVFDYVALSLEKQGSDILLDAELWDVKLLAEIPDE